MGGTVAPHRLSGTGNGIVNVLLCVSVLQAVAAFAGVLLVLQVSRSERLVLEQSAARLRALQDTIDYDTKVCPILQEARGAEEAL